MKKVHLFGFPPKGTDNTKVVIFDYETFGSSDAIRLAEGSPDDDGTFICSLPKSFKGKKLMLAMSSHSYVYINEVIPIEALGAFHTIKLRKETYNFYRSYSYHRGMLYWLVYSCFKRAYSWLFSSNSCTFSY